MSRKCYGSISVSKTEGRGSTPWRDAKYNLGCWYSWEHNALARHSHRFDPGTVHQIFFHESRRVWQQTVNLCESKLGSSPSRGAKHK